MTDKTVDLVLDEAVSATDLPRPESPADEVQQVPYRPVQFRDDDLPTALERSAAWLRRAQEWLGEPLRDCGTPRATTTAPARRTTRSSCQRGGPRRGTRRPFAASRSREITDRHGLGLLPSARAEATGGLVAGLALSWLLVRAADRPGWY